MSGWGVVGRRQRRGNIWGKIITSCEQGGCDWRASTDSHMLVSPVSTFHTLYLISSKPLYTLNNFCENYN